MAMHGHTKIELQDVNTGQKRIVEDDNMVTNGLTEMLRPANGWFNLFDAYRFEQDPNKNTNVNFLENRIIGGVVCFENAQKENPDNWTRDTNNAITAKGSNYAYSGLDTAQGSYNIQESGTQEDGSYKKVWDFSTNQGNGTIASVSLTTDRFGAYGDGCTVNNDVVTNSTRQALLPNGSSYFPAFNKGTYTDMQLLICYMDFLRNAIYAIGNRNNIYYNSSYKDIYFYNSQKITLKKIRAAFSKVSLLLNPYNMHVDEEIDIFIPDSILAQCSASLNSFSWYCDDGYIYILLHKSGYLNPGENVNVLKVRVSDFSTEVISITNTSQGKWKFSPSFNVNGYNYGDYAGYLGNASAITNKYVVFSAIIDNKRKLYRVNLDNNADISEFKLENGEDFIIQLSSNGEAGIFNRIGNMLYIDLWSIGTYTCNIDTCRAKYAKISKDSGETNYVTDTGSRNPHLYELYGAKSPVVYKPRWGSSGANGTGIFELIPFFRVDILFTINNLPTPVVKTASQTMKITYTITEE